MQRKKTTGLAAVIIYLLALVPPAAHGTSAMSEVFVPGDVEFKLELLSPISTQANKKGDEFTCRVLSPQEFANAYVSGRITKIKASGKVSGTSEIAMAFDRITMPDERTGKFSAQIVEVYDAVGAAQGGRADEEGRVSGKSTRKRDALKIGTATAIGAIIGGLLGGAQGAAIGGAIAAGLAITNTLKTKGPDLRFDQGAQFVVRTDKRTGRSR